MRKELTVTIAPDGQKITINAEGFVGATCMDFAKQTMDALGTVQELKKKDVYYAHEAVHVPQR